MFYDLFQLDRNEASTKWDQWRNSVTPDDFMICNSGQRANLKEKNGAIAIAGRRGPARSRRLLYFSLGMDQID